MRDIVQKISNIYQEPPKWFYRTTFILMEQTGYDMGVAKNDQPPCRILLHDKHSGKNFEILIDIYARYYTIKEAEDKRIPPKLGVLPCNLTYLNRHICLKSGLTFTGFVLLSTVTETVISMFGVIDETQRGIPPKSTFDFMVHPPYPIDLGCLPYTFCEI